MNAKRKRKQEHSEASTSAQDSVTGTSSFGEDILPTASSFPPPLKMNKLKSKVPVPNFKEQAARLPAPTVGQQNQEVRRNDVVTLPGKNSKRAPPSDTGREGHKKSRKDDLPGKSSSDGDTLRPSPLGIYKDKGSFSGTNPLLSMTSLYDGVFNISDYLLKALPRLQELERVPAQLKECLSKNKRLSDKNVKLRGIVKMQEEELAKAQYDLKKMRRKGVGKLERAL